MKNVHVRRFSGPYFLAFELNTDQKKLHIRTLFTQCYFLFRKLKRNNLIFSISTNGREEKMNFLLELLIQASCGRLRSFVSMVKDRVSWDFGGISLMVLQLSPTETLEYNIMVYHKKVSWLPAFYCNDNMNLNTF